jgi:hypothetical protein
MRFSRLIFATLLVIVVSTTFIFVKETDLGPQCHISNDSSQDINITAIRRTKKRDLGVVKVGSLTSFTVRGEDSLVFAVRYADGREIESKPIYFAFGTTVNISISEERIDVSRETDT